MSVCALGFYLARHILPTFYVSDVDVIELASKLFLVVAIFQVFDGLQAVAIGTLRGLADTQWPSVLAFVSYLIFGLPIGSLLAIHLGVGPVGIWIGLLVGLMIASSLMAMRFLHLSKRSI